MTYLPRTEKAHITQVDYIRAIASVAVALFHLGGRALPVLKYGWLGVQMFFLLSGFIICKSMPQNYSLGMSSKFIGRRLLRIEPPYIISVGLALLANFILIANYHPDWLNVLFHFAYLNNFLNRPYLYPVYWTLGIEFQFYLFIALLFPLFIRNFGHLLLLCICVAAILFPIPGSTLFATFPAFALGILYYLYRNKNFPLLKSIIVGALITTCFVIQSGWMPAAAAITALLILVLPLKSNPLINFLSKISFSLYLTHDIVGCNLVAWLGGQLPKTFFYRGMEFTSGIIVSIAFAWLFYLCVEAPFLKLSKRISY